MPLRSALAALIVSLGFLASPAATPAPPLSLDEALALADRLNETPRVAAARLDRARAAQREVIAALVPNLSFAGTYTRRGYEVVREVGETQAVIQAKDALGAQLVLDAKLLDPTAFPALDRAALEVKAQALDAETLRRALAFEVAESYFAVLSSEQLQQAAAERLRLAQESLDDASRRLAAGLADRPTVTRTELELAAARVSLTQAQSTVRTVRIAFGQLLGDISAGARPLLEPPAPPSPEGDADALVAEAETDRPDLRALDLRARAAQSAALEPRLAWLPTLGARATARATNESGLSGRDVDWNVAATLSWAIFDGGIRTARAAARDAELTEARLATDALRRRVNAEVLAALARLEAAEAALHQADAQAQIARRNLAEVSERFRHGLASALEQADASASAFTSAADLARQRFDVRRNQLALLDALGRRPDASAPGNPNP